jgi:uncharacterized membrane protein YeaQ/YmgE (transglycosylase-associated protein family)
LQNLGPREESRSSVRRGGHAAASGVRHVKDEPSELRCPLYGLLAPLGNFLCPGPEERTLRETEIQTGNSEIVAKPSPILDDVLKSNDGGKSMFHLLWYIVIGLISGVIAKSAMHVHIAIFWTIVLGIIGSILGGGVSHMFSRPTNERYHPAGLILSTLGAILILYICYKLNIHFPQV